MGMRIKVTMYPYTPIPESVGERSLRKGEEHLRANKEGLDGGRKPKINTIADESGKRYEE